MTGGVPYLLGEGVAVGVGVGVDGVGVGVGVAGVGVGVGVAGVGVGVGVAGVVVGVGVAVGNSCGFCTSVLFARLITSLFVGSTKETTVPPPKMTRLVSTS